MAYRYVVDALLFHRAASGGGPVSVSAGYFTAGFFNTSDEIVILIILKQPMLF